MNEWKMVPRLNGKFDVVYQDHRGDHIAAYDMSATAAKNYIQNAERRGKLAAAEMRESVEFRNSRTNATYNYRKEKKRLEMVVSEETALMFIATKTLSGMSHEEFLRQLLNVYLDKGQKLTKTGNSEDETEAPDQPKPAAKRRQKKQQS